MYKHVIKGREDYKLPTGKVVCVGRNYADHIEELNNLIPESPLLFMKPAESIVDMREPILIPGDRGECHNELEVALLIGKTLSASNAQPAAEAIAGVGLGLDLTLRDVQSELKSKGHPWERAKAFDGSCPLSEFVDIDEFDDLQNIEFKLTINEQTRQSGRTSMMLFQIPELLIEISQFFTLNPGDVVLTGTPKGVGKLSAGDVLCVQLDDKISRTTVIGNR